MNKILAATLFFLGCACLAQATPRVTIDQAASIAQAELKNRKLEGQIYITSIALETTGLANGERHWRARWSEAISRDDGKKEVGMKIKMDGSTSLLVDGPEGVEALRNHRTRSDRPSILDLKH